MNNNNNNNKIYIKGYFKDGEEGPGFSFRTFCFPKIVMFACKRDILAVMYIIFFQVHL